MMIGAVWAMVAAAVPYRESQAREVHASTANVSPA
jgi:hypothetical protein